MYATGEENKFLEVTYAKGEREIFYFKDFCEWRDDREHRRSREEARPSSD